MRSASRRSSRFQPVSTRTLSPSGVVIKVAAPPSTSIKKMSRPRLGGDLVSAAPAVQVMTRVRSNTVLFILGILIQNRNLVGLGSLKTFTTKDTKDTKVKGPKSKVL